MVIGADILEREGAGGTRVHRQQVGEGTRADARVLVEERGGDVCGERETRRRLQKVLKVRCTFRLRVAFANDQSTEWKVHKKL